MTVFNFPDTAGQLTDGSFQWTSPTGRVYIWDGNSWTSRGDGSGGGGDANITVTDNLGSIEQPGQGDLAYHTVEARMYIYYEDDDSKQWVDASPGGDTIDNTPDAYVFMPTGGGDPKERVFYENEQVITEDYDITAGRNAMSAGPVTIADGVSIGVGAGQTWTVVGGADNSGGDEDSGLWTRSGTTLSPANAGDKVDIDGVLISRDGAEIYRDGGDSGPRQMLKLRNSDNATRAAFKTDGTLVMGGSIVANQPNITLRPSGGASFNEEFYSYRPGTGTASIMQWSSDQGGTRNQVAKIAREGRFYALTTTVGSITSERRLKDNINLIDSDTAWETIKTVPFYSYTFKGDDVVRFGPMADEVPEEMVEVTDMSDEVGQIRTYDNGMLQARLYVALQTALTRIEALEEKLNTLEGGTATADITDGGNN